MILWWWIPIIIHLSELINVQYLVNPRVNPTANCGLWVIMTSHIGSSTVRNVPFAGDVDGRGGCVRVWGQGVHGDSVPSTQFCSEPKPVLKNKVYLKGKKKKKRPMAEQQSTFPHLPPSTWTFTAQNHRRWRWLSRSGVFWTRNNLPFGVGDAENIPSQSL